MLTKGKSKLVVKYGREKASLSLEKLTVNTSYIQAFGQKEQIKENKASNRSGKYDFH